MAGPAEVRLPTGAEYRARIRDGRRVWIAGERVEDVTTHPATAAVVDANAAWYDWHHDPAWREVLLTPPDGEGGRRPIAFQVPRTPNDLHALGEAIRAVSFPNAGNLTHPPGYGALIMLGVMDTVCSFGTPERAAAARAYHARLVREGLFMVAPFAVPQTDRFRPPSERIIPLVVKETDAGIVVRGSQGLGTSLCYADVAFVGAISPGIVAPEHAVWFAVPIDAPGVKVLARKPSLGSADPFLYPLSTRYDELDCGLRLDDVFIPWEAVFLYRDVELFNKYMNRNTHWLLYYHLVRQLARAEFSLGLALAVTRVLGTHEIPGVVESVTDLIIHTETLRTAVRAAAADAQPSPAGAAMPDLMRVATGMIHALKHRGVLAETVRNLAGHGGMLAPSLGDLADAELGPAIAPAYEGGGITARQRAAVLHLLNDHTGSALEGRGAAFEALATAGMHAWRLRAHNGFLRRDELVDGVLAVLAASDRPDLGTGARGDR